MNKRALLWAAILGSVCCLSDANATESDDTLTGSLSGGPFKVLLLSTGTPDDANVKLTNASGTTVSCTGSGGDAQVFHIHRQHPAREQMYKALLAAYLGNRKVGTLSYQLYSGSCWVKAVGLTAAP
jgi:hypothetical protein